MLSHLKIPMVLVMMEKHLVDRIHKGGVGVDGGGGWDGGFAEIMRGQSGEWPVTNTTKLKTRKLSKIFQSKNVITKIIRDGYSRELASPVLVSKKYLFVSKYLSSHVPFCSSCLC